MKLQYSRRVEKSLKKLPSHERVKVLRRVMVLEVQPLIGKALKGKLAGRRSMRVWPYRIIYRVEGKKVFILSVAHRQGVYK